MAPKKDKDKKKDDADPTSPTSPAPAPAPGPKSPAEDSDALIRAMFGGRRALRELDEPEAKKHDFWDKQPVPKFGVEVPSELNGPIDPVKTPDDIRATPLKLPVDFEWVDCDLLEEKVLDEVYDLLSKNYVEDDDNMFRFDYSRDFLRWALLPPGFYKEWHAGIRVKSTGKLVAFITAIPARISVHSKSVEMVEINFLCIHKKLRNKRLAPVLIREITRRVNRKNIWQAVYTAGVVLPKPIAKNRYYHRSLNPKKLIETGFSHLPSHLTMTSMIKLYKLPAEPQVPGMRAMEEKDLGAAQELLSNYLKNFNLHVEFSKEEFKHWFLPREGVINSFVVEDPKSKKITALMSFYTLASSVIGNEKHKTLKAAYSFYNVTNDVPLKVVMNDALILAKQRDFDVFNALDVMDNQDFIKELKFGIGDGHLQYYVYNWTAPEISPEKVGLVLL